MARFTDRGVVVTGAAQGIGRGIVQAFLDEGARVFAADVVPLDERADVHAGVQAWVSWLPEWGYVLPPASDPSELPPTETL